MRCPFLREAQVKSCQASAFRKVILVLLLISGIVLVVPELLFR